ncbi:MAG: hypothetical protein P9E24_01735 [Candidatus Competibacter sp.]|nr:hypothetical protein [Candidatus Competibacter sp.]
MAAFATTGITVSPQAKTASPAALILRAASPNPAGRPAADWRFELRADRAGYPALLPYGHKVVSATAASHDLIEKFSDHDAP